MLTRHEEIGRVGRIGRGCWRFVRNKSACRARGIWRTTRHTDKRVAQYTAGDRRLTNRVSACKLNGEVARHARRPRSILARMSLARIRRVSEDVTRMLRGNCFRGI